MATANPVQMERFAYDVFVHSMNRFRVNAAFSFPNFSENIYEHPDFLRVLSRGFITHQLRQRDTLKHNFYVEFNSNGLKKFKQISELLEHVLEEMDREPRTPMDRVITSLAVINELILFLFSKNRRLFMNELARLWRNYFAGFEKEFEEAGGLVRLYSMHTGPKQVFDKILDGFIPKWCCAYGAGEISEIFNEIYLDPQSFDSLDKIDANVVKEFTRMEEQMFGTATPRRKSEEKKTNSLENPGLGIPQHEKLLGESLSSSACVGESPKNLNAASTEEASANANTNVKLQRQKSGQRNREQVKESRQTSTQITCLEEGVKNGGVLTGSPISLEGQSKKPGGPTESPLTTEDLLKNQGALPKSPLSPEGQSKGLEASTGSPLSSRQQKHRRGSPRATEGTSRLEQKRQKYRQLKKNYPEGQLKERGGPTGSPVSPEGPLIDRGALPQTPVSPEGQSKRLEASAGSLSSSQDQKHRRNSPRTPESTSRLGQKHR